MKQTSNDKGQPRDKKDKETRMLTTLEADAGVVVAEDGLAVDAEEIVRGEAEEEVLGLLPVGSTSGGTIPARLLTRRFRLT